MLGGGTLGGGPLGAFDDEEEGDPGVVIGAGGIPSEEAFGLPTFLAGSLISGAGGIPSGEAFGLIVVTPTFDYGAAAISLQDAEQYLEMALGIKLPSFFVQSALNEVQEEIPDMVAAGYSLSDMRMIQAMATAIVASGGAARRQGSQAAPSGASRSFKYSAADLTALRRSLAALDTVGVMAEVVGPDPAGATMMMVVC